MGCPGGEAAARSFKAVSCARHGRQRFSWSGPRASVAGQMRARRAGSRQRCTAGIVWRAAHRPAPAAAAPQVKMALLGDAEGVQPTVHGGQRRCGRAAGTRWWRTGRAAARGPSGTSSRRWAAWTETRGRGTAAACASRGRPDRRRARTGVDASDRPSDGRRPNCSTGTYAVAVGNIGKEVRRIEVLPLPCPAPSPAWTERPEPHREAVPAR